MIPVSDYRAIISGYSWNATGIFGAPIVLTYSFSLQSPYYMATEKPEYVRTFSPVTEWERSEIVTALHAWQAVSGIAFIEARDGIGDLNFSFVDMEDIGAGAETAGLGAYPSAVDRLDPDGKRLAESGEFRSDGDVWFGITHRQHPDFATDMLSLALHEVGHTLGLKHPHQTEPGQDYILDPDPVDATVMSYNYFPRSLGPIDIDAIQHLYGEPASAPANWQWDATAQRVTIFDMPGREAVRGTALDDIIHARNGESLVHASMGNDTIHVGTQNVAVKAGDGTDIVHTQLALNGIQNLQSSEGWKILHAGEHVQEFESAEYIHFSDGFVETEGMIFVAQEIFDRFSIIHRQLVRLDPEHAAIERASVATQSETTFIDRLLASDAQDSTIPALAAYAAMLTRTPDPALLDALAAFVHKQIASPHYQATLDPRLGGYEALGMTLAVLSPAIVAAREQSDADFVARSYGAVFGRSASDLQTAHFVGQIDAFEAYYAGLGLAPAVALDSARGVAFGQMLGHAVTEAGNVFGVHAEQVLVGFLDTASSVEGLV